MKPFDKKRQEEMTIDEAIQYLKDCNDSFIHNLKLNRNLLSQVYETQEAQYPIAAIISCIDSRVSPEIIFDLGIGYSFDIRIAGNHINKDILGNLEFSTKLIGAKLIVVMAHTNCGAIKGACDNVQLGNLTHALEKIKPAVEYTKEPKEENLRNSHNKMFIHDVTLNHIELTIKRIREESPIIKEMEDNGEVKIVGCLYNIENGVVDFDINKKIN